MRQWLLDARTKKHMTLRELAEKIGATEAYVCNMEHGKLKKDGMNVGLMLKIGKALGMSPTSVLKAEIDYLR